MVGQKSNFNLNIRCLVGSVNAKCNRIEQSRLVVRFREDRQSIMGDRPIVPGAVNRVFNRAMLSDQGNGTLKIAIVDIAVLQHTAPERALAVAATPVGKDYRQRDLSFAEIVPPVEAASVGVARRRNAA